MKKRREVLRDVLTVPEVAAMKGVAATTVTRALKKYQKTGVGLKGEQRSRFWMIAREEAEKWMPPRPRKKKEE